MEEFAPIVVCSKVPPVAADHHLNTPDVVLLAVKATVPGPQLEPGGTEGGAGAEPGFTVASTAVLPLVQPPLLNSA